MKENSNDNKNRWTAIIRFKDNQGSLKYTEKIVNEKTPNNKKEKPKSKSNRNDSEQIVINKSDGSSFGQRFFH